MKQEESLLGLIKELYPICRSITGNGVRKSLQIVQNYIPVQIQELPTGTQVFDWTIPKEWNIKDAWIKNSNGEKVVDFDDSNLHVLNYSIPVDQVVSLDELKNHLYTLPDQPDLIPYRTSYYKEDWGFCLSHHQLMKLEEGDYHVYIDAALEEGSMTHGELFIKGKTPDEVIISCHICHPSLCNDNLSGISVAVHLAQQLLQEDLRYSYRFLFIPGTIGSIAWLARNEDKTQHIKYGLVLSCVGDAGPITYKKSRQGKAEVDRIVEQVLAESAESYEVRDFTPYGYDERQYCSPAFDLPVGCFMRTPFGEFPEYHTSADNLELMEPEALADSLSKLRRIAEVIENNGTYLNLNPKCEPNLGKRGLYKLTGGDTESEVNQLAILWVLNLSDGNHSLLDIAERAGMSFQAIRQAADALIEVDLLEEVR
ncbi:aminopeptidase-like domain-containing protein [Fodinibius roseus]|uniref:Aminopeptidase-like domain-containing protein n=1 Tax=Fodinibius roseus TaxID=1194090 RepID=A0A1M4SN83_9BACT|nr:DUF4910 domain-containing protein [Fodinibius roseus]SHE33638.1 aminopeptidase-like domain-containing protein [Fodinibius roseus]